MKTLSNFVKENLTNENIINEAQSLVDKVPSLPDDPDDGAYEDAVNDAAGTFEGIADQIEDAIDPKKLKKVFKGATPEQLNDYGIIISGICAWMRGIAAEAEDYAGEEDGKMMISMLFALQDRMDSIEETIYNMDEDWQSIQDGEDKGDMTSEVLDNWNAVCKALTGKIYNSEYK